MHGTAPITKDYSAQNVNCVMAEKPRPKMTINMANHVHGWKDCEWPEGTVKRLCSCIVYSSVNSDSLPDDPYFRPAQCG